MLEVGREPSRTPGNVAKANKAPDRGHATEAPGQAVSKYGSHAAGVRGAAIRMKTVGPGGRDRRFGCMRISCGSRFPFFRLQGAQEATMFSQIDAPPRLRGMTWSTVRLCLLEPQY